MLGTMGAFSNPGDVARLLRGGCALCGRAHSGFRREAARVTGAPAVVQAIRIEKYVANFSPAADVVTARALLPFKSLLDNSFSILSRGAIGLFPKGQSVGPVRCVLRASNRMSSRSGPAKTVSRP